jgi:hypothetical protein
MLNGLPLFATNALRQVSRSSSNSGVAIRRKAKVGYCKVVSGTSFPTGSQEIGAGMAGRLIDTDGLPMSEVGEWALDKHERLRRYVTITGAVRKKWLKPIRQGQQAHGATYIELFCGPGRSLITGTDRVIDGSALVAPCAAAQAGAPFSRVLLADEDPSFVDAACARLAARSISAEPSEALQQISSGRSLRRSILTDCISPSLTHSI